MLGLSEKEALAAIRYDQTTEELKDSLSMAMYKVLFLLKLQEDGELTSGYQVDQSTIYKYYQAVDILLALKEWFSEDGLTEKQEKLLNAALSSMTTLVSELED